MATEKLVAEQARRRETQARAESASTFKELVSG
jgi:hypothetical protein